MPRSDEQGAARERRSILDALKMCLQSSRPARTNAPDEPNGDAHDTSGTTRDTSDTTNDPERMIFFIDATEMLRAELNAELSKAGKAARLSKTLVTFAEQQDSYDCLKAEHPFLVLVRQFLGTAKLRLDHGLHSWHYKNPHTFAHDDETFVPSFDDIVAGEQNKLRGLVTRICLHSHRRQLRPLDVEVAVTFAWMMVCGAPFRTELVWKYRKVLASAIGASVHYVESFIQVYDESLHRIVGDFLEKLKQRLVKMAIDPKYASGRTAEATPQSSSFSTTKDTAILLWPRKARNLEYAFHQDGTIAWSKTTRQVAEEIAPDFVDRFARIHFSLTELVAQFWDNLASMTCPIRKFEHGKNRFLFRTSTGELCTGTKVRPKLSLEEIRFGAGASATGGKVMGLVTYKKSKPDLQVVTTDYGIDCSINVPFGRTRLLGMRERRAIRVAMILAHYTKYNLDMARDTDGMFQGTFQKSRYRPLASRNLAPFTCNSPPDLISLLLSNQVISTVSRNGITIITGFVVRGQQKEIIRGNVSLYAKVGEKGEESYPELVSRLIDRNDGVRVNTPPVRSVPSASSDDTGSQKNGWKPAVSGSVRILAVSRGAYLLSRDEGDPVSYQFHELTDAMLYDSYNAIYIL